MTPDHKRLSKRERQDRIIAELQVSPAIRASEIAARLGVHVETVRRDLKELDNGGLINRTYGGASVAPLAFEPSLAQRDKILVKERRRIGNLAAQFIEPDDVVMVDAGSTTIHFARQLVAHAMSLTVITNSYSVATVLARAPSIRVILCPGDYDGKQGGVRGPDTIAYLRRFHANTVVIGAGGLSVEGPSEFDPDFAWVKRTMIERAQRRVLVVDHGKFGRTMLDVICPLTELNDIVVDAAPDAALMTAIEAAAAALHVAED